jgi:hypothetical protein
LEWAAGVADFVHDPGLALHEDLPPDARATGDSLGRAVRMGGEEPARHLPPANHCRECTKRPRAMPGQVDESGPRGGVDGPRGNGRCPYNSAGCLSDPTGRPYGLRTGERAGLLRSVNRHNPAI